MITLHSILVYIHIAVGAIALVLFWVPALAKKGSRLHVRAGRYYTTAMYTVAVTAFLASVIVLADPLGIRRPEGVADPAEAERLTAIFRMSSLFLLMLSVLVFASIRHGLAALAARRDPAVLRRPSHVLTVGALALLAAAVGAVGLKTMQPLLAIFAGIGIAGSIRMFREIRLEKPTPRQLTVAHLSGLIGSGIGAYTAFFAFGGARFFGDILPGLWQIVPWVLPAIIGTFVINRLKRPYEQDRSRRPASAT